MGAERWLCLVTDRRRLTRAAGRAEHDWRAALLEQAAGAARGGVTLIHIRERDLAARELLALTQAMLDVTAGSATRIVVNDRLDIALTAGAAGVHLRGDSPDARRLLPLLPDDFLVGRSVHTVAEAREIGRLNYFVAGTVFPTRSKADIQTTLGTAGLEAIVRAAGDVPVLAIGGITEETASRVAISGVRGVASIGAFLPQPGQDIADTVARQADTLKRMLTLAAADH